ncbi:hypothetical protein DS2_19421 [Catenovulum agarivorans DS-2]|uniref:Uncharacterized protein n=1 Tax=Catenovulum agarivorans DS-2 TaxID=1328313 RepID=W7Q5E9_9ALTE|nr:hypothetical protein [Catenovulum agarivorans]EWH08034.1 hypothetical protein DS2_19421 [Catenovulum agarivorans DS-2]
MSQFITKLSTRALASEDYKKATNELFRSYVFKMVGQEAKLNKNHVKQLVSVAQYFYRVNDNKFRKEGSSLLSMLIDVCGDMYPEIIVSVV